MRFQNKRNGASCRRRRIHLKTPLYPGRRVQPLMTVVVCALFFALWWHQVWWTGYAPYDTTVLDERNDRPTSAAVWTAAPAHNNNHTASTTTSYKIAVSTVNIGGGCMVTANHQHYCRLHGYEYRQLTRVLQPHLQHPAWQKFPHTLELFDQGYDYVFWMDGDAIFANMNQALDGLIQQMEGEHSSMLFSGETLVINSGQVLWKNDQHSRKILSDVEGFYRKPFPLPPGQENGAFAAYLAGASPFDSVSTWKEAYARADDCHIHPHHSPSCEWAQQGNRQLLESVVQNKELLSHLSLVPQVAINSYWHQYQQSHFIFHCAGIKNKAACLRYFERQSGKQVLDDGAPARSTSRLQCGIAMAVKHSTSTVYHLLGWQEKDHRDTFGPYEVQMCY